MISINGFLMAYLSLYLFSSAVELILDRLNRSHLKKYGKDVPAPFEGVIDEQRLQKITAYTRDKIQLTLVRTIVGKGVFLFIILSGLLPWLAGLLEGRQFVVAGLIFFAVPGLLGSLTNLPFDYYHTFVIEERFAFNTTTVKVWLLDLLKSLSITLVLGAILLSLLLLLVHHSGTFWWVWAWLVFFSFQLLMTVLYPTVIAPIFNKFTPLEDDELSERIRNLAEKEGFTVQGIYQMDAAKRSRHTNAYFSGLGRVKRIVLFDTLIENHAPDEILAVLAHEIGHFKKNHIKKQILMVGISSIILLYLASAIIKWGTIYQSFGFSLMPAYSGLFLAAIVWEPIGFFLSPIAMAISRKFEREADGLAVRMLKTSAPLVNALKKMARDNLSNLRPHPTYALFNYSHPPLLERIERLEAYR